MAIHHWSGKPVSARAVCGRRSIYRARSYPSAPTQPPMKFIDGAEFGDERGHQAVPKVVHRFSAQPCG